MECEKAGCKNAVRCKGLCASHYRMIFNKDRRVDKHYRGNLIIKKGGLLHPPNSLPYRALARTCKRCGDLISTPLSLIRKDAGRTPRCKRCGVSYSAKWYTTNENSLEAIENADRAREETRLKNQAEALEVATNYGKEWTGPELELVARRDITAVDLAKMLRRTPSAVSRQRHLLNRRDPRTTALAGLASAKSQTKERQ